jgi:hypothetical protein
MCLLSSPMGLSVGSAWSRRRPFWRSRLLVALLALLAAATLALAVNVPRALACPVCVGPDKVTLSGDGIIGTATIIDPGLLAWFGGASFIGFDQRPAIAKPVHTGTGVELTRYFKNSGVPASFWTVGFDHMRYYPGAPGQPGFVFYEGPLTAEGQSFIHGLNGGPDTGQWYALTRDEDDHVRQLLTAADASPKGSSAAVPVPGISVPGTASTQPPAILRALTSLSLPVILLLAILLVLVAAGGYRIWSARRRRTPFIPAEETLD